jgi:vacuolar-type H+-ATPase subunit I/STV1
MMLAALARRKLEQRWEITAAGRRALEAAELEAVLEESALQELRVIGEEEERRAALEELRELERLRELEDCWGGPRDDYGLRELEGNLLRALGLGDHARPESCHALMQADIKQGILDLRERNEELEAELVATPEALGEGPYSSISEHAGALRAELATTRAELKECREVHEANHG